MADITSKVELFKTAFPGKVTTPDLSAEYLTATSSPWSQTCWSKAAAYIDLGTAEEVSKAVLIINQTGVKFAIRTTGHNPNPGFSSTDSSGIVLNLRDLQSRTLTKDGIARVGAGNTWGEIYSWLEDNQLSVIGGRDTQVGVSGFLLGGGMGGFPNLHGLGTDNVKGFQVVLSDGRIVNANDKENVDLYTCLKGGGSNFGIVTRFDLRTHPLINVQYSINLYSPSDYIEILKATIKVQEAMEADPCIGLFTNFNAGFVAVGLLYSGTVRDSHDVFAPFHALESLVATAVLPTTGTLLSLAQAMSHGQEPKKRTICSATTRLSQELYEEVQKAWVKACKSLPGGVALHFTIQPVGKSAVQIGQDRGGNILGLENVPQSWWVFTCEWTGEDYDDELAHRAVNSLAAETQRLAQEREASLDFLCMNFAGGEQQVLRSYGANNVSKMQNVASKYDKTGVFQKHQNGGHLLP